MRPDLEALTATRCCRTARTCCSPAQARRCGALSGIRRASSPEDSRLRFFSRHQELSDERIHELTHLDYERAMAFIAFDEATSQMLGVVRPAPRRQPQRAASSP
jgi:hypothetical protein